MRFETGYDLIKYGLTFNLIIEYEYVSASTPDHTNESLQVMSVTPSIPLEDDEREEIELHCWTHHAATHIEETQTFLAASTTSTRRFETKQEPSL